MSTKGAQIGEKCSLGQNVNVSNNVKIGNGVKDPKQCIRL